MKRKDIIVIGIIVLIALISLFILKTFNDQNSTLEVVVTVDSVEYKRIPFTEETVETFTVEGIGGYNVVEIKDGNVNISDADCPDQVCVYSMAIDDPTDVPIVCLPHKVIVSVESTGDSYE